ncbi:MAG: Na/Pi cotransporter family protein [Verrucomicrobia bacterium]|jgi:phosphate:Na+ symporter|nr:Na/Pi cotransporter family protein [Verrucomicrobiota bacterium]MBT7067954.1 Na/Pi cotransporter family protein [Verrucomicrobiota bacterium]MBT7699917.1 Na/Pi cotransporter family protein [Verrucomicrobiota bacterium]
MEYAFLIAALLGGLALFIFGMGLMTDGLREASGSGLRTVLARAGRSPLLGILLGTVLGTLVHSSAATVMLVGFVNAGLLSLAETVPATIGSCIGTTISMQAVSLKLGDYCYFAIALGFIISAVSRQPRNRQIGRALLGFGLLFLGMNVMSEAIRPHRDALQPLLAVVDGRTWQGTLIGLGVATALTAVWQSSGATIGMCFALTSAGVFTELHQVFPIVMGANIGTCATALLSSIGTHIEARRTAVSHLLFKLITVALALGLRPWILQLSHVSSSDLIHQTANMNTLVMTLGALVVLPFWKLHAIVVRFLVPSRGQPPEPSHLDPILLKTPERAIMAAIDELRRAIDVCRRTYSLLAQVILLNSPPATLRQIKLNEKVVNEIKVHVKAYLHQLTHRQLSRRQLMLMQEVSRCMSDIERIGDHLDKISDISVRRKRERAALLDEETLASLFALYRKTATILLLVQESLRTKEKDFQAAAQTLIEARDSYARDSQAAKELLSDEVSAHRIAPIAALFYRDYLASFDRIVKHARAIALSQQKPDFRIKARKLDRAAAPAEDVDLPSRVDSKDFLQRLHMEDYI